MQPNKRFTITHYQAWLCFAWVTHTIIHTPALCRHGAVFSHMTGVLCCFVFLLLLETDWIPTLRDSSSLLQRKEKIANQQLFSQPLAAPTDSGVSCPLSSVHLIWFHLCLLRPLQGHKVICLHVPDTHPVLLLKDLVASYVHAAPQVFFFFLTLLLLCLVFLFSLFMGHIYIYTGCLTAEPFFIVSLDVFEIRRPQAAY